MRRHILGKRGGDDRPTDWVDAKILNHEADHAEYMGRTAGEARG